MHTREEVVSCSPRVFLGPYINTGFSSFSVVSHAVPGSSCRHGYSVGAALAAHAVYCMPRMRWPVVFTLNARLQDDTQRWDLLLAKEGVRAECVVGAQLLVL